MVRLGKAYQCGRGVACNSNKALRLLKKAVPMSNKDAMAELAHFSQGSCTGIDKRVLTKVCTEEAKEGNSEAMFIVGMMLFDGDGVDEDRHSAIDWWRQAITGSVLAIWMLVHCYEDGDGVDKDAVKAICLLTMGADKANDESTMRLAWHFENVVGVDVNLYKAYQLCSHAFHVPSTKDSAPGHAHGPP